MAYTIHKSDGTSVSIADNSLDSTYYDGSQPPGTGSGVLLVGRNTIDYGAAIAQNFLQMTENFCDITGNYPADTTALQGMLWFDKTLASLYVRVTAATTGGMTNWERIITVSDTETGTIPVVNPSGTPNDGDIQVVGAVISIYANSTWNQVFPAVYS